MTLVPITTEPGFSPGRPEILFEGEYLPSPAESPQGSDGTGGSSSVGIGEL